MELIELFSKLAQIDSVSGEEQNISDFVMQFLINLGLKPEKDKSNMIYCRIGRGQNPKLFCAHMDTVEPGRGVKVNEENGFLVSNGKTIIGGDNKVSLTAILFTIQKLTKENINAELIFSVREETDSGIQNFDYKKIQSKVGFVFDGGNGDLAWLAQTAPTIQDFKITIKGKSSHASLPEDGINVLNVLIDLKDKIKLGRPDEFTTLNIGLIKGGSATNTIPELLTLEGDLRSTKTKNFASQKNYFDKILKESAEKFRAEIDINWIPYSIGYEMNFKSENLKVLKELYAGFDLILKPEAVNGGSDAAFLNSIGIETFCLGDAVIDPHSTKERIEVLKFRKLQEIVEKILISKF